MEMFTLFWPEPVIVQRYLPDVRKGDKRIILVDGKVAGAINRVPASGESPFQHARIGGRPRTHRTDTAQSRVICDAIGPEAKRKRPRSSLVST